MAWHLLGDIDDSSAPQTLTAYTYPGDHLVKMQILVPQAWVGPKTPPFGQAPLCCPCHWARHTLGREGFEELSCFLVVCLLRS